MSLALALSLAAFAAAPSDQELTDFGKLLASEITVGKDPISSRVDGDALLDRALNGAKVPPEFRKGFMKGLRESFPRTWGALVAEVAQGGSIRWTRNVSIEGHRGVQLRVLFKDGAFNFVEFLVNKNGDSLTIIDLYDLSSGTLRSTDLRMLLVPLLADLKLDALDRLLGKEQVVLKHADTLKKLNEANTKGEWEKVRSLWQALPKELQDHRLFIRQYISALSSLDEKEYVRAMARYLALYPDDAAAQVMGIDFHFLRKKWPECLRAIAAVEKRAGPDAWFDYLRGNVMLEDRKLPEAKAALAEAVKREPSLGKPYYLLIDISLHEKRFADTTKWMTACEKATGVTFDTQVEGFEEFLASKEGKAWVKAHPAVKQ